MKSVSWSPVINAVTGDLNRLSSVWRYNSIPTSCYENDIEHLGWVCIYSLMIHKNLRPDDIYTVGAIATHAISHDITESVTGDIIRTFKYSSPKLKQAINEAEEALATQFPKPIRQILDLHEEQLKEAGLIHELQYVRTVVKMADFMSLWMFMGRELDRGNRQILPYHDLMIEDLKQMRKNFPLPGDGSLPSLSIRGFYAALANHSMLKRQMMDSSYLVDYVGDPLFIDSEADE